MARIDRPIAGTKKAEASRAEAASRTAHAIDWRQLSHELRTPLNAILGNVELLLDGSAGPLSAQARTWIAEVQVAGRELLLQVRLLLAWSELSASGPNPGGDPVDLIALVREASALEGSRPAQIAPHDACLPISGDPFWLRMLVTEVVACYGAPDAAPKVRLETAAGHRSVRFFRPGFCAERAGALRIALIESMARLQGAEVAPEPDGLTLHCRRNSSSSRRLPGAKQSQPSGAPRADHCSSDRVAHEQSSLVKSSERGNCSRKGLSSATNVPIVIASIR